MRIRAVLRGPMLAGLLLGVAMGSAGQVSSAPLPDHEGPEITLETRHGDLIVHHVNTGMPARVTGVATDVARKDVEPAGLAPDGIRVEAGYCGPEGYGGCYKVQGTPVDHAFNVSAEHITVTCSEDALSCDFSIRPPDVPGWYQILVWAVDRNGNEGPYRWVFIVGL